MSLVYDEPEMTMPRYHVVYTKSYLCVTVIEADTEAEAKAIFEEGIHDDGVWVELLEGDETIEFRDIEERPARITSAC
jgi:hypothetical protein